MPSIDQAALEQVYDTLADSLDAAGEGRRELFLVKLALLLANDQCDVSRFAQLCRDALADL